MSRAFVTDKEDWIYCAKAGERCMHADADKECSNTNCEHFHKKTQVADESSNSLRIVKRKTKKADKGAPQVREHQPRTTKKSSLPKPKKWGGRSGSTFPK